MESEFILVPRSQFKAMVFDACIDAFKVLQSPSTPKSQTDRWMTIAELSEYLPGNPAVTTLYGKVQRREIPYKKMGKRLVFLKSEIDQWLKEQHRKCRSEINMAAEQYVLSTQTPKRK